LHQLVYKGWEMIQPSQGRAILKPNVFAFLVAQLPQSLTKCLRVRAGIGSITGRRQEAYYWSSKFLLRLGGMYTGENKTNQQENSLRVAMPFHLITLSARANT
jgi:hypothetical protein